MFKALTPIIGILVAVGVFFTYVRPTFEEVKVIQSETAQYEDAVDRASELQQRINELRVQQNAIAEADRERLVAFLPDRIDEVSLLIDIDKLATTHGLKLSDIDIASSEEDGEGSESAPAPLPVTDDDSAMPEPGGEGITEDEAMSNQYTVLDISFTASGTYDDFRMFLEDIERSLVLMEIVKIEFAESEGDLLPFDVTLRFYSLNAPV